MSYKRMLAILACLTVAVALSACSAGEPTSSSSASSTTLASSAETTTSTDTAGSPQSSAVATTTVTDDSTRGEISRSGPITQDEVWSGTVHITGDVVVKAGHTLTILPGTVVLFAAHRDDTHGEMDSTGPYEPDEWIRLNNDPTWTREYAESHIKLDVYGTLVARGTPDNWITFTSDSSTPDGGDWMHVQVNINSQIEYCIIEYSRGGLDVAEKTGSSVLISHNIMRHNLWTGLAIHSCSPTVTFNEIYASGGHQGIDILGENCAPLIAHNLLRHNKVGIIIQPGTTPVVESNILVDNDHGITAIDSIGAVIRANTIDATNGAPEGWSYMNRPVYPANAEEGRSGDLIGIRLINSSPLVVGNQVMKGANGMSIEGDSSPEIRRNTIVGSTSNGLFFAESFSGSPVIHENNIYGQSCNVGSVSAQPIEVSRNWWGTTDVEKIAQTVRSQGPITYEPFLEEPVELP